MDQQGVDVLFDGGGQGVDVIASFKQADDLPVTVCPRDLGDAVGQGGEIDRFQPE